MRSRALVPLPIIASLAVLAACTRPDAPRAGSGADVPEAPRYGGTAVIGSVTDIGDVSPLTWNVQNAQYVQMFVLFMPLIAYDEHLRPVPRLARSWEVNADTTLLTFHLRDDVWWQDGVKTTAKDVKFSYDLARDPRTGFINSAFWTFYGAAEATDSFTFRVHLRPHAGYMDPWRAFAPVPEHVLRDVPAAALHNHPFGTTRPVGNGPFRFVARRPGQSWTFEANPRFPRELGGRAYLDRLVYRVVPEPTVLLEELETGGVDFFEAPPADQVPRIRSSTRATIVSYPDREFEHVVWNERRPPFADARVRRALTLAINRQRIVSVVRHGFAQVANSTVPPIYPQYDSTAGADLRYDPAGAKRLLAQAGWIDRDGDGVLEDASGRPFRFTLKVAQGYAERKDAAEMVQADLQRVGIDMAVQTVEFNTLIAQASDPRKREFDAIMAGWLPEFRIDDSDLFACRLKDGPLTWTGYCQPETDRLLDSLQLLPDPAAALPLWRRYQRRIAADQPFTILYFPRRLEGVSRRLRNVRPDARGDYVGVERWWVDTTGSQ
jgi:peptide/nickel transport system substrate-binding protein